MPTEADVSELALLECLDETELSTSWLPRRASEPKSLDDSRGEPLITIGIPTRNRSSLLKNCLTSALAQTYSNIEVLVSNNASTDGTQQLLQSIKDKRLRVLTNETNIGIVENFSRCVDEAKGDYLVLASDDNVFTPGFIDKCVELIRKRPGLPIVLSAYDVIVVDEFSENATRVIPAILSKNLSTGIWDGTTVLAEYLSGRISAQLWSSIVRLDILRRIGGYSPHPCSADEATWIPFLLEGKAGYVAERCATYLVHGASHSSTFSPDNRLKDLYDVMQEVSLTAERKIATSATRHRIQRLAQRYVVQQAMVTLVLYRRAGASLIEAFRKFWNWRPMFRQCTARDFLAGLRLRSLVRIMLPAPLARLAMALGLDRLV